MVSQITQQSQNLSPTAPMSFIIESSDITNKIIEDVIFPSIFKEKKENKERKRKEAKKILKIRKIRKKAETFFFLGRVVNLATRKYKKG